VSIGAFLLLGFMRDYQIAGLDLTGMAIPATEFEVVFGNAYDIFYQKQSSGVDPPGLYQIEGLLNLFPQQIFPIEKPNLSRWYADTFYPEYALLGGGFGFGVIAEALLSDTPVVAVAWRAVFHGVLLAMAFNAFKGSRQRPVQVAAYVWVTVLTYQIFRDTTFALVPKLLFDLFPAVAIVYLILLVARAQRQESGAS